MWPAGEFAAATVAAAALARSAAKAGFDSKIDGRFSEFCLTSEGGASVPTSDTGSNDEPPPLDFGVAGGGDDSTGGGDAAALVGVAGAPGGRGACRFGRSTVDPLRDPLREAEAASKSKAPLDLREGVEAGVPSMPEEASAESCCCFSSKSAAASARSMLALRSCSTGLSCMMTEGDEGAGEEVESSDGSTTTAAGAAPAGGSIVAMVRGIAGSSDVAAAATGVNPPEPTVPDFFCLLRAFGREA